MTDDERRVGVTVSVSVSMPWHDIWRQHSRHDINTEYPLHQCMNEATCRARIIQGPVCLHLESAVVVVVDVYVVFIAFKRSTPSMH